MSRFINFASNLLDGVDSMAKDSLIDQGENCLGPIYLIFIFLQIDVSPLGMLSSKSSPKCREEKQ